MHAPLPTPQEDSKVVEGRSTLQNLSSYLTLSRAKDKYNFDPAMLGMGDKEVSFSLLSFFIRSYSCDSLTFQVSLMPSHHNAR